MIELTSLVEYVTECLRSSPPFSIRPPSVSDIFRTASYTADTTTVSRSHTACTVHSAASSPGCSPTTCRPSSSGVRAWIAPSAAGWTPPPAARWSAAMVAILGARRGIRRTSRARRAAASPAAEAGKACSNMAWTRACSGGSSTSFSAGSNARATRPTSSKHSPSTPLSSPPSREPPGSDTSTRGAAVCVSACCSTPMPSRAAAPRHRGWYRESWCM
mmetsp:Transcript_47719/g.126217  ORF Transcript_47719/g.126217 Transcript_47719/m.126217 type:complete len:217 (+) Transcript_47719:1564-2214(+)